MKTIFFLPSEQFARFERLATMLAESTFGVPEAYRGDVGSCLNAVDIAHRLNVSPLVVLQNVRDVGGRPSFTYQFAKALIEDSGVITGALQYETEGELQNDGTSAEGKPYRVRAYGTSPTGVKLEGPWISWRMAQIERWTENTQYISMPEVMFRARATTFFFNQHASSLMMGFQIEGDPAIGYTKAKPALAAESLQLPVFVAGSTEGTEVFAKALEAAPKADTSAMATIANSGTAATGDNKPVLEAPGQADQQGTSTVTTPPQTETPKPRGRKPRSAGATDTQAQQDNSNGAGQVNNPPQLTEQDAPPPVLTAESAQQATLDAGQTGEPASVPPTETAVTPQAEHPASEGQQLSSIDRFSDSFVKVDATVATGASLKEAMEVIRLHDAQEADDLYMVLLGNAEKHLTSFIGRGKGLTPEEGEFAGAVRELHMKTKETAAKNPDVAQRRKALGDAYTAFLAHLNSIKQGAAA